MATSPTVAECEIVILAPRGRDGSLLESTLKRAEIAATAVKTIEELCARIETEVGAVIVTEEALHRAALDQLRETLGRQPKWSDVPIVLLTSGGETDTDYTWKLVRSLSPAGSVSLLERPLRPLTIVSAAQVALRARQRQYEVRAFNEDLENRVTERTAELQRINAEAEGFSYTISHDLRAPLRAIIGTSMMLLEDFGDDIPEDAKHQLKRQANAANRLGALIDDLLHLSRLSRQEMQLIDFNLTEMAEAVAKDLRARSAAGNCTFDIEPGLVGHGDPLLVQFVLMNLMENACKFSPRGGAIRVGRSPDGAFFVQDDGIGFDMSYANKLFMPFERLVRDDQFPGTGIGLANVRRIIERHGGKVWAESTPGHGATFRFSLPAGRR
jgi:signal transduction histidine kinase